MSAISSPPECDAARGGRANLTAIRWLTYLMFMMFAMTTDSIGVVIPEVIKEFKLSLTAASAFHYTTMAAIGLAGVLFGFLADKLGHKKTILLGLSLFAADAYLFIAGSSFGFFLGLLAVSGTAIGIFKTGALALIGDVSRSTTEHTSTMNAVEGFFGVGAIVGPAIIARLISAGVSWKWLYVIAATLCVVLIITALLARYPEKAKPVATAEPVSLGRTLRMIGNPYAFGFSIALFLYVAVECAIYVWMPTLLAGYHGNAVWVATYALSLFFVLRAAGRFLGSWLLSRCEWTAVVALFSGAILACFVGSLVGGMETAVFLLPLSGLFMSVMYPTLNSKGISCFPKSEHGTVAGVILFFSCLAAALGPFAMGVVSDWFGEPRHGFVLATGFAALFFVLLLVNWLLHPVRARLAALDQAEYGSSEA
jgi:fucose permease